MAQSPIDRLKDAVTTAIEAAQEIGEGNVTSLTVDYQASGEYPFRAFIPDEPVPFADVAYASDRKRDSGAAASPPKPDTRQAGVK
jgi:hypothetical protein